MLDSTKGDSKHFRSYFQAGSMLTLSDIKVVYGRDMVPHCGFRLLSKEYLNSPTYSELDEEIQQFSRAITFTGVLGARSHQGDEDLDF